MRSLLAAILLATFISCEAPPPEIESSEPMVKSEAQQILDDAMAAHGVDSLTNVQVDFDFRGRHFTVTRQGGAFSYVRTYSDSTGAVREVLNNDGVSRFIEDGPVELTDQQRRSLESSLNSVVYFALLPYSLNDAAVQKRYLGEAQVGGEPYDKIEVTFAQDGGGRDWEDRFVYWFHAEQHTMDYLAYTFEVNGGGTRFRQAFNTRTIGGIRFADYHNFAADSLGTAIEQYDTLFEQGEVKLLSEIVLENVTVTPVR